MSNIVYQVIALTTMLSMGFDLLLIAQTCILKCIIKRTIYGSYLKKIFWMTLSDFCFIASLCFELLYAPAKDNATYCHACAFLSVFFNFASQTWYFLICCSIFSALWGLPTSTWTRNAYFCHAYVWFISSVVAVGPLLNGAYQINTVISKHALCWIDSKSYWGASFYMPTIIYSCFAVILLCYATYFACYLAPSSEMKRILISTSKIVMVFLTVTIFSSLYSIFILFSIPAPTWLKPTAFFTRFGFSLFYFLTVGIFSTDLQIVVHGLAEKTALVFGRRNNFAMIDPSEDYMHLNSSFCSTENALAGYEWLDSVNEDRTDYKSIVSHSN